LENAGVAKGFRKHFPNSEAREMGVSEWLAHIIFEDD
jgi:hypothetical protein